MTFLGDTNPPLRSTAKLGIFQLNSSRETRPNRDYAIPKYTYVAHYLSDILTPFPNRFLISYLWSIWSSTSFVILQTIKTFTRLDSFEMAWIASHSMRTDLFDEESSTNKYYKENSYHIFNDNSVYNTSNTIIK